MQAYVARRGLPPSAIPNKIVVPGTEIQEVKLLPIVDEQAWREDIRLLDDAHRRLRLVVAELDVRQMERTTRGRSVSNRAVLSGIIAHDLYHAGQIQLLKKLKA